MKQSLYILTIVILSFFYSNAQDSIPKIIEKRSYTTKAIRSEKAPSINGIVDEPVWDLVEWTSDYTEFEPDVGTPPTEQTKFKILYFEVRTT